MHNNKSLFGIALLVLIPWALCAMQSGEQKELSEQTEKTISYGALTALSGYATYKQLTRQTHCATSPLSTTMYVAKELSVLGVIGGFTMAVGVATLKNVVSVLASYREDDSVSSEKSENRLDQ